MSFPRKNEDARIYRDKDKKSYFIVYPNDGKFIGSMTALANVYYGPEPSPVGTSVNSSYIAQHWLKRMAWDELPLDYQQAFTRCEDPDFDPKSIRGFWHLDKE